MPSLLAHFRSCGTRMSFYHGLNYIYTSYGKSCLKTWIEFSSDPHDIGAAIVASYRYVKVFYTTGLCPDVDIDHKMLRSGVRVDHKLLHLVRIASSDVDIELTMSHQC